MAFTRKLVFVVFDHRLDYGLAYSYFTCFLWIGHIDLWENCVSTLVGLDNWDKILLSPIIKFKIQEKNINWKKGCCLSKIPKISLTIKWKSYQPLLPFSFLSLTFSPFSHLFISGIKLNDLSTIFLQQIEHER